MNELLERLRLVIANYRAFIATRTNNNPTPAPPQNNRKAVAAYYGSQFCVLVFRFCQQNNEFVKGNITAAQRNATQQALLPQINALIGNAQAAFGSALSTEADEAAIKGLPAPQTQVLFKEKVYAHPNDLINAMQAEVAALVVGQTCNCALCGVNQQQPPTPIQAGQVITFAARFNGDASLVNGVNPATATAIMPSDVAQYNSAVASLAQSLIANPQLSITISVGSNAVVSIPNGTFANNMNTALGLRAQRVLTDFVNQGIAANRIMTTTRPLNGGANNANQMQAIIITIR